MTKRNIHTVPYGNGWANKKEGVAKPVTVNRTKAAADAAGTKLAKQAKVEHVIHGKDGKIQDKDSYGNDPHPPIDRKH